MRTKRIRTDDVTNRGCYRHYSVDRSPICRRGFDIVFSFMLLFLSLTMASPSPSRLKVNSRAVKPSVSSSPSTLNRWVNFGKDEKESCTFINRKMKVVRNWISTQWKRVRNIKYREIVSLSIQLFRAWIFWYFSKDCFRSIYDDQWHAERNPKKYFGDEGMWVSKSNNHNEVVKRRIKRNQRNRQWIGIGYTPRFVWLIGVLLRGTLSCTSTHKIFRPKLTG